MSLTEALPYGIRDLKLTPYLDASGSQLGTTSYDLPNMQTLTFSEKEEFQELRGDDRIVTTRGKGAQVEWSLEAGGLLPKIWSILTGGEIIEAGTTPNITVTMRKRGSDSRPYFRIEGQVISDTGGDIRALIYRCRCNASIQGDFKDGEFFITKADGLGLPLLDDTNDLLYDIIQNETQSSISLTPVPNPRAAPQNLTPGTVGTTTITLTWDAVVDATGYVVEKSVSPYTTWTTLSGTITTTSIAGTGLTTATAYKFRVKATFATAPTSSDFGTPTGVVTTS